MRIIFAGTPIFASTALTALIEAAPDLKAQIIAAYTQPDRPAGRGQQLTASPVKQVAAAHGIPVYQPASLRDPAAQAELDALQPDLMIVAAYGLILPQAVLEIPKFGCLNIHASLLPRWRGAAPIQRAIESGDKETGVGIMRMEAGLDTGPVLHELRLEIGSEETAGELHDRLAVLGAQALIDVVTRLEAGQTMRERRQSSQGVTYAHKIKPEQAHIDWTESANLLARRIRAFNPTPGCTATVQGLPVKIWRAKALPSVSVPLGKEGAVLRAQGDQLVVACGEGALAIEEIQRPGGRRVNAAQFVQGMRTQ